MRSCNIGTGRSQSHFDSNSYTNKRTTYLHRGDEYGVQSVDLLSVETLRSDELADDAVARLQPQAGEARHDKAKSLGNSVK